MPPKKGGVVIKSLVGKEIMLLSKYEKDAEGPYVLTGVDLPFICIHCARRGRSYWFNIDYIVSMTEVVNVE